MQTYICVLVPYLWFAALILLLGILGILLLLALFASLSSSSSPDTTRAEIRSVGHEARGEMKRTAGSYQHQAQEILSRKR
jgi:hypothetical protein